MKKVISSLFLVLCLMVLPFMFAGCGKKEYLVTFHKAIYCSYSESLGTTSCAYGIDSKTLIEENAVIGEKKAQLYVDFTSSNGKTYRFEFKGWYAEPYFQNKWNIYQDKVNCNLNLYPKYEYFATL